MLGLGHGSLSCSLVTGGSGAQRSWALSLSHRFWGFAGELVVKPRLVTPNHQPGVVGPVNLGVGETALFRIAPQSILVRPGDLVVLPGGECLEQLLGAPI